MSFPYETGRGDYGDCIKHKDPVGSVHIFTESKKVFPKTYCIYQYTDNKCGGNPEDVAEVKGQSFCKPGR